MIIVYVVISRFILLQMGLFHSFLWQRNMPLCIYTTSPLFIIFWWTFKFQHLNFSIPQWFMCTLKLEKYLGWSRLLFRKLGCVLESPEGLCKVLMVESHPYSFWYIWLGCVQLEAPQVMLICGHIHKPPLDSCLLTSVSYHRTCCAVQSFSLVGLSSCLSRTRALLHILRLLHSISHWILVS